MTALATRREKHLALTIAAICFVTAIAIVPFARVPLAKLPSFIPSYEAALLLIDLVTAVVLFDQFLRLKSVAVLALASGYLFDAFIIVPHALSFPGAFTPTGLLGAKEQTTAWLYVFWHGGFPLFVIAYAFLRDREASGRPLWPPARPGGAIVASISGVAVLTAMLALLDTWGHDALPVVMQGSDYSLLVRKGISPAVWVLTLLAMVALWERAQRMVDLWLMLVMWIWLFDIALAAVIGSTRFDLGFYAGRIFGLLAASFLLITLVVEMAQMYARALAAAGTGWKSVERARGHGHAGVMDDMPSHGERTESFIHRQNIARYRSLLESGSLDDAQHRSVERLLSEEEARHKSGGTGD